MSNDAKYVSGLLAVIGDPEMLKTFLSLSYDLELTDIAAGNLAALVAFADEQQPEGK